MNIKVLNFSDAILLGTQMEPMRSITQGMRFGTSKIEIVSHSDYFLRLNYVHEDKAKNYSELVPWIRVDKCLFTEEPTAANVKPKSTKV